MAKQQKAMTSYECPVGAGQLGHSGRYTGSNPESAEVGFCICGERWVEVAPDGYRYKVEFETVSPLVAADTERAHGKGVWPTLSDEEWNNLRWYPITSDSGSPVVLRAQYERLLEHSQNHEQPIRNVRMLRASSPEWEQVNAK